MDAKMKKKKKNIVKSDRLSQTNFSHTYVILQSTKLKDDIPKEWKEILSTKDKSKPGWEFRLETQIENPRKKLKVIKQKKNAEINRNRKEKTTQGKLTIQLEEICQKVLAKEGRLKRYRESVKQYGQNRTFQNNERKLYQQLGGDYNKTCQQPEAKEPNDFELKYGNQKKKITIWLNG